MLDHLDRPALGILLGDGDLVLGDHPLQFLVGELGKVTAFDRDLVGLGRLAPAAAGLEPEDRGLAPVGRRPIDRRLLRQ